MLAWSLTRAPPQPAELCVRLLVAAVIVLVALHVLQRTIVEPLIPILAGAVHLIDPHFLVLSAAVGQHESVQSLVVRADLAAPMEYAGRTLYPLQWNTTQPAGWFQIELSLSGLLQYSGLLMILALAWPVHGLREFALRLALCLPVMAVLIIVEVPCTVVAELWSIVRDQFAPGQYSGWLVWSRFLMGGGGLLIGSTCAVLIVTVAGRATGLAVPRHLISGAG
jgi:hypothetical protein